jgi:hypothetical protein
VSYALRLKADKGFISLEGISGQIPDGDFEIQGHKDIGREDLGIYRREPDGRFAGSAHHSHPVPVPAPDPEPDPDF